jgi:hypothetical protein
VRTATILVLAYCGSARAQGTDDVRALLEQVQSNVRETISRLPKYVCTLTIDRARYATARRENTCEEQASDGKGNRRLLATDRLRLDVAVNGVPNGLTHEMYSWVGADRFSDRNLFELVPDGALSTGSFASMLASIFGDGNVRFSYSGDNTVEGRLLSEFGFHISEADSEYLYLFGKGRTKQAAVAYQGTFLVDPKTGELVRLVVRAPELPREAGACELTQTLDYAHAQLGGAEFLLPSHVRLTVAHMDASEAENTITYSACHEFKGESALRFTDPPDDRTASSPARPAPELSLPPGLSFRLAFANSIDTRTAAAGDPIQARLKTAIRDRSSAVLVPEGAKVTGRIMSLKRFYTPSLDGRKATGRQPSLLIAVRLETLEVDGVVRPFHAAFDAGLQRFSKLPGALGQQVEIGSLDPSLDRGTGVFEFWTSSPDYVVSGGLESSWYTVAR